jgi:hypothetical protein
MTSAAYQPARFTLDRARAENWLRHAVAAYMTETEGAEPPADLEGPEPDGELPEISDTWNPVDPGQENAVFLLVERAVAAGIIGKPEDTDIDFEYVDDSDGGYYYFLIRVGNYRLKLASVAYEMRKIGERDATGATAALAILDEAVSSANSVLADLEKYIACLPSPLDDLYRRCKALEQSDGNWPGGDVIPMLCEFLTRHGYDIAAPYQDHSQPPARLPSCAGQN